MNQEMEKEIKSLVAQETIISNAKIAQLESYIQKRMLEIAGKKKWNQQDLTDYFQYSATREKLIQKTEQQNKLQKLKQPIDNFHKTVAQTNNQWPEQKQKNYLPSTKRLCLQRIQDAALSARVVHLRNWLEQFSPEYKDAERIIDLLDKKIRKSFGIEEANLQKCRAMLANLGCFFTGGP